MTGKTLVYTATLLVAALDAAAQDSSLLLIPSPNGASAQPGVATLVNSSFMYSALPPEAQQRPLAVNDIIRVLVDYRATIEAEGDAETRKIGVFSAALNDWIAFDGQDIFAAPQRRGDPTIAGNLNSQLRAESDVSSREGLTFTIAATIVDIRPNGDFVIEARREITVNEEHWTTWVTGTVSRQFVGPDRTVRDSDIANVRIGKREIGAVRDGYRRGWLGRLYGKYKAF